MIQRIVIGDWSDDGHCQKEYYSFECNAEKEDIRKAYKQAAKKSGIALHTDYRKKVRAICNAYQDSVIDDEAIEALKSIGVDFKNITIEENNIYPEGLAILFFEMVRTQLPNFEYKLVDEVLTINGFWQKDFNHMIGYGCFGN